MNQRKFAIMSLVSHGLLLLSMSMLFVSTIDEGLFFNIFFGVTVAFWVAFIARDIARFPTTK